MANCVRDTISFSAARGSVARASPLNSGSVGKSSRGSVCIRESNRSAATFTPFLSSSIRTSVSGRAYDLVELLRRERQRSTFGHRRVTPAAKTHFQISCEELDFSIARLDEHVGENRDGVLALDDALE